MTQDAIIDIAKQNLFSHMMQEHGITLLGSEITDIVELCKKIIQSQAQPTPSQSDEERVEFEKSFSNYYLGKFADTANYINSETYGAWTGWQARAQLSNPQPTSQEYCCIDSWENAKEKAWNNRDFKLCKCDINESCSHCYPSDFKDGGKWDLCKPMKASK